MREAVESSDTRGTEENQGDSEMTFAEKRLGYTVDKGQELAWGNVGNIYWLGHDLIVFSYAIQLGAPKEELEFLSDQCLHHVRHLKFTGAVEERLVRVLEEIKSAPEHVLDALARRAIAVRLIRIRDEIGAHMEGKQKGFRPFAKQ